MKKNRNIIFLEKFTLVVRENKNKLKPTQQNIEMPNGGKESKIKKEQNDIKRKGL